MELLCPCEIYRDLELRTDHEGAAELGQVQTGRPMMPSLQSTLKIMFSKILEGLPGWQLGGGVTMIRQAKRTECRA
jgi:hypothetical protein